MANDPFNEMNVETREISIPPRQARLVEMTRSGPGRSARIGARAVTLGRDPEATIQVEPDDVSRLHARISIDRGGRWVIEDLDSRNGTFVNDISIHRRRLAFGDRIRLGQHAHFIFVQYDDLEEQLLQYQKMESVGRLAGGIAHDFNNLIGVILVNVDFVLGSSADGTLKPAELVESLEETREAAKRAAGLTRQLLDFARRGKHQQVPIDFTALVEGTVGMVQRTFPRDIEIETDVERDLVVLGDPSQLNQVVMNLLVNARDAMPEGGSLTVRAAFEALEAGSGPALPFVSPGNLVVLSVTDTGAGMSEEICKRVFEPFFSTKERGKGTGLGLATAYGVVKKHGGNIQVSSAEGVGTTFRVYLPASTDSADSDKVTIDEKSGLLEPVAAAMRGKGALLVDDEPGVRSGVGRLLRRLGFEVFYAPDGEEAVRTYEANRELVQLVLLDVIMPKLDGAVTYRILRRLDPHLAVLLLSGDSDDATVRALLKEGARGFLRKPFNEKQLAAAIARALEVPIG